MIYLILGENAYKAEQELARLVKESGLTPERLDGSSLTNNTLADIVRGGSLFSDKRLVVLRQLSDNKPVFEKLAEWAGEVVDDTTLVLLETKLDRRTKAYKALTKAAKVTLVTPLTEREHGLAEEWLRKRAREYDVGLAPAQVRDMVQRALVPGEKPSARLIDQLQLEQSLKSLAGAGEVTDDMIATVLPPAVSDTVFDLMDMAAQRNMARAEALLSELERTDDAHRTLALVMGQWAQLVAVSLADGPSATIAVELGLHPYVAKKLQQLSLHFTRGQIKSITVLAAQLDAGSKLSQFSPRDGVYRLIQAIAQR